MGRREIIADLLKQHPDTAINRIAVIAHSKHGDVFPSFEAARAAVRYYTGRKPGDKDKPCANIIADNKERAGAKIYSMPKSRAKAWVPYEIKGPCCVGVLSDIHFPKHDERALENAVKHLKGKVDVLVLNGDIADAEEFGSWAKSPKAVQTEDSVQCIRDGLLWLLDQFPAAKVIYKFGNHEERLDRYCWGRAPELVGMPHITWEGLLTIGQDLKPIPEMERIEWVKEQRPIMAGKLPIFHGHELPKSLISSVNPARGAFLRLIDTVLVGHFHRSSSHVEYNWQRDAINCWSTGCLCDLTPQYAVINKWNWGFACVDVDEDGQFDVHNYKLLKSGEVVGA
jgi:predicted phosphodiesterase